LAILSFYLVHETRIGKGIQGLCPVCRQMAGVKGQGIKNRALFQAAFHCNISLKPENQNFSWMGGEILTRIRGIQ